MKLTIGNYEVEIKAKGMFAEKMNKEDTMYFLNKISSVCYQASLQSRAQGWEFRADDEQEMSTQIYEFLDNKGFYNDIRKNA